MRGLLGKGGLLLFDFGKLFLRIFQLCFLGLQRGGSLIDLTGQRLDLRGNSGFGLRNALGIGNAFPADRRFPIFAPLGSRHNKYLQYKIRKE